MEKQKTFVDRNGDSTGEEIGFPNFILKKARISVHLQFQINSLPTRVVSLEPWILQTMVWSIITWETSTMVPLSCVSQDSIFHRHVRLDIWRCRSTRIHVRLHAPHRKTTNSNGNQVCRAFCRPQWESSLFVCYQGSGDHLAPITQSSDDLHRDTLSVDHRWETHGILHAPYACLLLFTLPPSCCVVRTLMSSFSKKQVRNRINRFFTGFGPNVEVCQIR